MTNEEGMNTTSAICMDILVHKPRFPDFAFILYDGGWFTHHVILERAIVQNREIVLARGARRENRAPSQVGEFNRQYADNVFNYMELRESEEDRGFNIDEVAVIPFGDREKEILSLGEILDTHTFPDGITVKTLGYRWRKGKRIKIYSPPNISLDEYLIF